MPEQTLLLIEAGRMAADPRHPHFAEGHAGVFATDTYCDTTDRLNDLSPYPSTHDGFIGLVAADGHGIIARIVYYNRQDGQHDTLLGRVGNNIYNWNGGHSNGRTDLPARE